MYWQEDTHKDTEHSSGMDAVVDLVYSISCQCLPVDHAHALSTALLDHLPWLKETKGAGVHPISIPEAGHGWMRAEGADELLHLSKRTKLILRAPKERVEHAENLEGKILDVAGHSLEVLKMQQRPLQAMATLFSRYNVIAEGIDEEAFIQGVAEELAALGIQARKMLPGRKHILRVADGELTTTTLMIADLSSEDSLKLQQHGIGVHQHMGCGLFIPQKSIAEVHEIN